MKHVNWIVAAALAAFGITAIIAALPLDFWPARFGPGEGFLPIVIGAALVILSLGIAVVDWRERNRASAEAGAFNLTKPIKATLSLVDYIICFGLLGFIISTAIFMTIYLLWVEVRSMRLTVTVSLAVTFTTHVIFVELLGVDLPPGVLEGVLEGVQEWIS
jgi:putative tricarboxylic transport membrane protein